MMGREDYQIQVLDCCCTCHEWDIIGEQLICGIDGDPVHPLGICNQFTAGEIAEI
jgi:hypothetical protein